MGPWTISFPCLMFNQYNAIPVLCAVSSEFQVPLTLLTYFLVGLHVGD